MTMAGSSGVDMDITRDAGSAEQWSWSGTLSGEKGDSVLYHTIIKIDPDKGIQISLSSGTDSYAASLKRDQLQRICENPCLAYVDPAQRISRIQAALKSDGKETTRVIRNGDVLELRISVPWGSEFGDLSIKLDIAGIPLLRSPGKGSFLDSAFESITTSRAQSRELEEKILALELEFKELWEAKKRLDVISRKRNERMQIFADALNEYKRKVCAESAK